MATGAGEANERKLEGGEPLKPTEPTGSRGGFLSKSWVSGPVSTENADLILLAHSLATGLVDSASFSNWGVFCGMQTGRSLLSFLAS